MALLETQELTKNFGGLTAVNAVDLEMERGEVRSIIGPNGAGKTTFINLITSLLVPSSGRVLFDGTDITDYDPHEIVQAGISRTFQTASIFPEMTVEENVQIASLATEHGSFRFNFLKHRDNFSNVHERTEEILADVELLAQKNATTENLSYGDKRRLEIALALTREPDLLFMDEPTAGMSPEETQATVGLIEELQESLGLTVVLVEHDMEIVFEISDKISVLNRGQIIADGSPDTVSGDPAVQEAYLGGVEL